MAEQITTIHEIQAEAKADAITGETDCKYQAGSIARQVYWEQREREMSHISADWAAA